MASAEAKRFVAQSMIGVVGNGGGAVLSVAYVSAAGHMLGPAEYGVVAAALSLGYVVSLLLNPLESGVSKIAAEHHGRNELAELGALLRGGLVQTAPVALTLFALWTPLSILLKTWLGFSGTAPLAVLGVFLAFSVPLAVVRGVLRGAHMFGGYALNQLVEALTRLLTGLGALMVGIGAAGALSGYALGCLAALVAGWLQLRRLGRASQTKLPRSVYRQQMPLLCVFLFLVAVVNLDVLAAKRYLPAVAAGEYGAAASLSRMIYLLATPVYQVLFSHVSSLHAQQRASERLSTVVTLAMGCGLAASLVVPIFGGRLLLAVLFGPGFVGGAGSLPILWLATSVLVLEASQALALVGTNRTRGSVVFLAPVGLMAILLANFHTSALQIAWCSLAAVASGIPALWLLRRCNPQQGIS